MTFPTRLSFGDFIALHAGKKWVYAKRTTDRLASQYPGSIVILPKQQRDLAAAYKAEWGDEHDLDGSKWKALCALREVRRQVDYCGFDDTTRAMVVDAIKALTS